ncbi:MAG: hypothetical protein FDZ69_02540 [Deltaproteobacteria bacterium]|nr:MAG: hypothetical protein FDZ69_02540 [Deltaproteobacteria bacterium]
MTRLPMIRLSACRTFASATVMAAVLVLLPVPARALTQHDWMVALVDSLGRLFGLPDQPKPEDYINILQGKRKLRLEAETVHAAGDGTTTMTLVNFGPFSGPGWLMGAGEPISVHLHFILPLDGRYRVAIAARRPGHSVAIGGQIFSVDADPLKLVRVEVGELFLGAGHQEVVVTLPPGGGLDYLELSAANLPAIAPQNGWQPQAPLTWDVLASTALQALGLGRDLPLTDRLLTVEAESLTETGGARVVEDVHLGRPSEGRWRRAATQPATLAVPLLIDEPGFYDIGLTAMGTRIDILLNGHLELALDGKPYLDTVALPTLFLPKGESRLDVTVPPGGGLDRVTVRARQSSQAALAAVLGLPAGDTPPTSADLDRLTARLSSANR